MAEWRPEGWENPYAVLMGEHDASAVIYERSADAVLAALREGGIIRSESLRNMPAPGWKNLADGDWVFIPDAPTENSSEPTKGPTILDGLNYLAKRGGPVSGLAIAALSHRLGPNAPLDGFDRQLADKMRRAGEDGL